MCFKRKTYKKTMMNVFLENHITIYQHGISNILWNQFYITYTLPFVFWLSNLYIVKMVFILGLDLNVGASWFWAHMLSALVDRRNFAIEDWEVIMNQVSWNESMPPEWKKKMHSVIRLNLWIWQETNLSCNFRCL